MEVEANPIQGVPPVSRRSFLAATGGLTMLTIFPTLLAACGSDDKSSSSGISGQVNWLGFEGEDGQAQAAAWLSENDVTINAKFMAAQDDILNALTIGTPLDLVAPFNGYVAVLESAGLLQPFDPAQIPNFEDLFPVLKEASFLRGQDGSILAVPIIWGDGPYIFDTDSVPAKPPDSVLGLADPLWKDQLVWLDDPYSTIVGFARALGFENPTELSREQLDQVVAAAEPVMSNVVSIASSFGDASDMMIRGDASLSPIGWRVMVQQGAEKGVTLEAGQFADLGTAFCDCYALPKDAKNVAAAQAYTNEIISPAANAALATALQSGAVTEPAFEELDEANQTLYDYDLVRDASNPLPIINILPPNEPADGIMGATEWQEAWNSLKS